MVGLGKNVNSESELKCPPWHKCVCSTTLCTGSKRSHLFETKDEAFGI